MACPTASRCLAVGRTPFRGSDSAGIPYGSTGVVVPVVGGHPEALEEVPGSSELLAVSCSSATRCVAVGGIVLGLDTRTTPHSVEHVGVVVPIVDGVVGKPEWVAGTYELSGVKCWSTDSCLAVGGTAAGEGVIVPFGLDGPGKALVLSRTGPLDAVACPMAAPCVAVGSTLGLRSEGRIVEVSRRGDIVSVRAAPSPLDAIACRSFRSCLITGGPAGVVFTMSAGQPVAAEHTRGVLSFLGVAVLPAGGWVAVGYPSAALKPGVVATL